MARRAVGAGVRSSVSWSPCPLPHMGNRVTHRPCRHMSSDRAATDQCTPKTATDYKHRKGRLRGYSWSEPLKANQCVRELLEAWQ